IVSDVTAQRQLEQQQSLQTLEYKFVDESLPSGFVIASPYPDFHIEFINKTMLRMLRYDSYDDFIAHVGYSAWSFIHPDDLDRTRQAALHCGDSIDTFEIDYRILRKDGSLLWVNQCSKHAVNAAGKPLVFAYYTDITESKQKDEELRRDAQRYQALVESIPGGVGVYKFSKKPIVTYFNDRVATLCGLTREEYQQIASDDAMAVIYPEDRAGLAHEIEQAIAEKRNIAYTYRLIVKDKGYVWIHLSGCPMEDSEDGYPVYSTVFLDINADKQRELELKTQQQKLQVALKNTDTYIWEFDFKQHCILQEANSQSVHGYSAVIQNVPQSLIESGFVHSDYIPAYRDIFRQLFEGAETASGDFLVRTADQSGWWRERITYTTIFDESGLPYKAIGVGKDITEHTHQLSLLQNRYNSELAYKNALKADNLLATVRANVSCDAIEEFDLPRLDFPDNYTGACFSDSLLKISKYIVGDAPRAAFLSTFNLETLRSSFSAGEKSFHVEHKRQFLNGDIRWVSTTAKLLLRPDTDELICFLYSYDINEEKVLQEVLHTVVELDYDYVISIDGKTDHYMLFPNQ
ncbi:MAG: PAS domain-containing protein, partial [Pygmaiobacter sp.]